MEKPSFQRPGMGHGMIQIVHDFVFTALNVKKDYSFLETADSGEKRKHIQERLARLKREGFGGVVLNIPFRGYLEGEEGFRQWAQWAACAKQEGFRVWLYDEQYYPSGSGGGKVLEGHPELENQALVCVRKKVQGGQAAVRVPSPYGHSALCYAFAAKAPEKGEIIDISRFRDPSGGLCWNAPEGDFVVYCFFRRALYEMTYLPVGFRAPRRYPAMMDARAVSRFLTTTFAGYEKQLPGRLGDYVEAVFTDEPSNLLYTPYPQGRDPKAYGAKYDSCSIYDVPDTMVPFYPYVPWIEGMEDAFLEENGYSIKEALPAVFDRAFPQWEQARADFFRTVHALFSKAYFTQYAGFVKERGMQLTGHFLSEENIFDHPFLYGNLLMLLEKMDIPGCDILYSDTGWLKNSLACKFASSAAYWAGKPHVMVEASNMLDENQAFTTADFENAMALLYAHGIDTITSYYGEELFDEESYGQAVTYAARLHFLFSGKPFHASCALYYPYDEIIQTAGPQDGQEHPEKKRIEEGFGKAARLLWEKQIPFVFVCGEQLLQLLEKEEIETLVLPDIPCLSSQTGRKIKKLLEQGKRAVWCGKKRKMTNIPEGLCFAEELESLLPDDLICSSGEKDIRFIHKSGEDEELYLVVDTKKEEREVALTLPHRYENWEKLNLRTGEVLPMPFTLKEGRARIAFSLLPKEAWVFRNKKEEKIDAGCK